MVNCVLISNAKCQLQRRELYQFINVIRYNWVFFCRKFHKNRQHWMAVGFIYLHVSSVFKKMRQFLKKMVNCVLISNAKCQIQRRELYLFTNYTSDKKQLSFFSTENSIKIDRNLNRRMNGVWMVNFLTNIDILLQLRIKKGWSILHPWHSCFAQSSTAILNESIWPVLEESILDNRCHHYRLLLSVFKVTTMQCFILAGLWVHFPYAGTSTTCADPESFFRWGPILTTFLLLFFSWLGKGGPK